MGGIVTRDVVKINNDFTGPIILTPDALIELARRGAFFDISLELISDKSKSNLLGKGLVCIQVIWFLIQCIARAAAGYPLALLEVHTMVYVVCALLMYALWWEVSLNMFEEFCISTLRSYRNLKISPSQRFKMCLIIWTL